MLSFVFKSCRRIGAQSFTSKEYTFRRAYATSITCFKVPQAAPSFGYRQCYHSSLLLGSDHLKSKLVHGHRDWKIFGFQRNITLISKRGKKKSVKSVVKRFKRLGCGALKRWRSGKNHNMRKKSTNQKRRLRKPVIVRGRQLRKLNKMLNGW